MTQYPFEPGQYAHIIHGLCSSFCMGIIKCPIIIGYAMQPMSFAADIDARFIRMRLICSGQLVFDPIFKVGQKLKGFFVKIENRPFTDRYINPANKYCLFYS